MCSMADVLDGDQVAEPGGGAGWGVDDHATILLIRRRPA
jgi:hypothetical protein